MLYFFLMNRNTLNRQTYLITGNLGYVGPHVVKEIRKYCTDAQILGFDAGFFSKYVTSTSIVPEAYLDQQYFGDVRKFPKSILENVDVVISLAAISNDPIGNKFEKPTMEINYEANLQIAEYAKQTGVGRFVFASSCSVYGAAEDAPRTERSDLNPLTAYARSKIDSEKALSSLANKDFQVTCLRFATACGMSERLRLDLVLNDFVAGALSSGTIDILSDGTPWRPLIHVADMARAIRWASQRSKESAGDFLTVNTGSNRWNYQVRDLAFAVQEVLPKVDVRINENAEPDKRSYRVNFDLFENLAPDHQPLFSLNDAVTDIANGLSSINFSDANFRKGNLMRLNVVRDLLDKGIITPQLSLSHDL